MKPDWFSVVAIALCVILAAFCVIDSLGGVSTLTVLPGASSLTETTPPPSETEAPPTEAEAKGTIAPVHLTSPVARGNEAELCVRGEAGVTYEIKVYYSSGASSASGLEAKTADESGLVQWTWRVGASVKAGEYRIVVSGGGDTLELKFTVT